MYAVSAAASAYFLAMWKRADADLKSLVWRRYGWFSALAFFGSIGGLVTAVADIQFRYISQRVLLSFQENNCGKIKQEDYQDDVQWVQAVLDCARDLVSDRILLLKRISVSPVPYAIEFLCICCANLLVRLRVSVCAFARRRALFAHSRIILSRLFNEWWILSARGKCLAGVG
jgi:hypothetical protein